MSVGIFPESLSQRVFSRENLSREIGRVFAGGRPRCFLDPSSSPRLLLLFTSESWTGRFGLRLSPSLRPPCLGPLSASSPLPLSDRFGLPLSTLYYTILYYTIPYYTTLYYTILCYAIPYHTIPYHTMPYHTILYCPPVSKKKHACQYRCVCEKK